MRAAFPLVIRPGATVELLYEDPRPRPGYVPPGMGLTLYGQGIRSPWYVDLAALLRKYE